VSFTQGEITTDWLGRILIKARCINAAFQPLRTFSPFHTVDKRLSSILAPYGGLWLVAVSIDHENHRLSP